MLCVGGQSVKENILQLSTATVQVIVGTPGRIFDLYKRRVLKFDNVKVAILEGVGDLLMRGFEQILGDVFKGLKKSMTDFFS
jgi:translation initiation factor 4A